MSGVAILLSGTIFKEPQQRTSQSGRSYVVTTVKAAAADNATSDFWSIMCFSASAGEALMRLGIGERLAVQGSLKLETYTAKDGETKISRTVFADHVLAVRQRPRRKNRRRRLHLKSCPSSPSTSCRRARRHLMMTFRFRRAKCIPRHSLPTLNRAWRCRMSSAAA
jgi:single-stranded DNA-binding protein